MRNLLLIFIVLILPLFCSIVNAQSNTNSFDFEIIQGKILEDSTQKGIPSANIYNESDRRWEYANEFGEFKIWADLGDTLVVSAIGFLSEVIILSEDLIVDSLIIRLQSRSYEIGEAIIQAPKKYAQFKNEFVNLDLPRTELDSVTEELAVASKQVIQKAEYDRMVEEVFNREKGTLFVLGTSIRTKKEKDQKKLKKVKLSEEEQDLIYIKYNREIVKKYTRFNDNELTEFMSYCNFSNEFLLHANAYEIGEAIIKKLNEYKKQNHR